MRRPLQRALDDLRFGATRTLDLRRSLPTAAEATRRADAWLRAKQAEGVREVLVVTGRGNQSYARVPVVREAVHRLLSLLITRGVVADVSEHTPGSFAVRLAPLGRASRGPRAHDTTAPDDPPTLEGLSDGTRARLRILATASLGALGFRDPPPAFVHDEMVRQCAILSASLASGWNASADARERQLLGAIERALDELYDERR